MYKKLSSKDREKDIYNLAKTRERKARDFNRVKCIKGEDSKVLVRDEEINYLYKDYFEKLLNENHLGNFEEIENSKIHETRADMFFRRRNNSEVYITLKKMKLGKTLGPDEIPIEAWKCLGNDGVLWLTKLFNRIITTRKRPDEWRKSNLVHICKNKGDIKNLNNYRGRKLMSHTMKLWERGIERCPRVETIVSEKTVWFYA